MMSCSVIYVIIKKVFFVYGGWSIGCMVSRKGISKAASSNHQFYCVVLVHHDMWHHLWFLRDVVGWMLICWLERFCQRFFRDRIIVLRWKMRLAVPWVSSGLMGGFTPSQHQSLEAHSPRREEPLRELLAMLREWLWEALWEPSRAIPLTLFHNVVGLASLMYCDTLN